LIEVQIPKKQEEVHSSPTTEKNLSERHSIIQQEYNPSSYNIEETFEAFIFNLLKSVRRESIMKSKMMEL
jgi:hypothetical protein